MARHLPGIRSNALRKNPLYSTQESHSTLAPRPESYQYDISKVVPPNWGLTSLRGSFLDMKSSFCRGPLIGLRTEASAGAVDDQADDAGVRAVARVTVDVIAGRGGGRTQDQRRMRTCCATPAGSNSPRPASTPGRYKPTSGIATSSIRCATPSWRRIGLRTSGETSGFCALGLFNPQLAQNPQYRQSSNGRPQFRLLPGCEVLTGIVDATETDRSLPFR